MAHPECPFRDDNPSPPVYKFRPHTAPCMWCYLLDLRDENGWTTEFRED